MLYSTVILIILSLFLGTGVWLIFLWAVNKGEFDDLEAPKFRMLDDDPAPHPLKDEGTDDDGSTPAD